MKKSIKIENLPALDGTAVHVLRVIVVKLGDKRRGFVDYNIIAKSLHIKAGTVARAVVRLEKRRVLRRWNGELELLDRVE